MRIRVTIDDDLLESARRYAEVEDNSAIVNKALKAFVEREASRRLAAAGGSMPDLEDVPRRRPWVKT